MAFFFKGRNKSESPAAMDRRQFAKIFAGGGLGLGLSGWAAAEPEAKPAAASGPFLYPDGPGISGPQTADVVIVGAGLSGLIAARSLQNWGLKVCVVEARERIGGRMYLDPDAPYLDLGGQWVGETQFEMRALVDELKITPFVSFEEGWSLRSFDDVKRGFDGSVATLLSGKCDTPHCPPDVAACKTIDIIQCGSSSKEHGVWQALLDISAQVPHDRPWDAPDAKLLDSQTFESWLIGKMGAEGYSRWLPTMQARIGGSGGFEPGAVSLLHMAWTQKVGPQAETPEKWLLRGGAGQIPERLANRIVDPPNKNEGVDLVKGQVILAAPVKAITSKLEGVIVTGPGLEIKAFAVIVAIPPPLRAGIEFTPALPPVHSGFAQRSPMGSMSKVHAVYKTAFWRKQCFSGSAAGNLKTCEFIADSSTPEGKPGVLTSFIAGDRNLELSGASDETIRDLVLDDYAHYFGDEARKYDYFVSYNWNKEKWTGGAFTSYLPPGVWTSYGKGWRTPVHNIFWAGTETSDRWPGYYDGAIRAGKVAAQKVLCLPWAEICRKVNLSCHIPYEVLCKRDLPFPEPTPWPEPANDPVCVPKKKD